MAADGESSSGQAPRVIKRYSNRKLYDTSDSRYVTLPQIREMVQRGEHVQIIDNKTKEDKTEATLALILSEDLKSKPRSVPLGTLRTLIQERGERLLESLRDSPVGRLIPGTEGTEGEQNVAGEGSVSPAPGDRSAVAEGEGAAQQAGGSPDKSTTRARLDELVETSRHTLDQLQEKLDERVRAVVPLVGPVRELREELSQLRARVQAIEERLGMAADDTRIE